MLGTVLLSPAKGLWWILRELHNAVEAEQEAEGDRLTQQLTTLHMRLEMGEITEDEFDEAEAEILDRLDALRGEDEEDGMDGEDDLAPAADDTDGSER